MLKDILVHLDGSTEDDIRIAFAQALAETHDAHLGGLYCNILPDLLIANGGGYAVAEVAMDMQNEAMASGNSKQDALKEKLDGLDVPTSLMRIDAYGGAIGREMSSVAHKADLFLATRLYGHQLGLPEPLEAVLFDGGRACLFVPPGSRPRSINTVMIAWRDTREAARALAEAMPFIEKAAQVNVVVVEQASEDGEPVNSGGAVVEHLGRHAVEAKHTALAQNSDVASVLLDEADRLKADLLVMGGYGHSRFREWVLGGVTRDILERAQMPVLVAH